MVRVIKNIIDFGVNSTDSNKLVILINHHNFQLFWINIYVSYASCRLSRCYICIMINLNPASWLDYVHLYTIMCLTKSNQSRLNNVVHFQPMVKCYVISIYNKLNYMHTPRTGPANITSLKSWRDKYFILVQIKSCTIC